MSRIRITREFGVKYEQTSFWYFVSSIAYSLYFYMGQIPQDGNFGQNVAFFVSLLVAKPKEVDLIVQLILVNYVPYTLEAL